jgi:predicted Rossmann-fold nucleotide-binding protein
MVGLYTSADLLSGYVAGTPASYIEMWDFKAFQGYVATGGEAPIDIATGHNRAEHDADISFALGDYLGRGKPVASTIRLVGIMGGHSLLRTAAAFKTVADVARDLTGHGYQIATGGGPGGMEAGHFGAYFANSSDAAYAAALARLQQAPRLADLSTILTADGKIAPGQEATIQAGYDWLTAALEAKAMADGPPGESLAIPTWKYGSEPTTPFASVYAKYYTNSIREESLIAEGKTGVLYAQGGGGTLREIFQDVELNYYARTADAFIPMIFVDPDGFWEKDATYAADGSVVARGIKLGDTLAAIFKYAFKPDMRAACAAKIEFTVDPVAIRAILDPHAPSAQANLSLMLQGEPSNLLAARLAR